MCSSVIFPRTNLRQLRQRITTSANVPSTPAVALKPGDLLYAVIDTGVNSDVPSAVMGTVASGAFKNGRLLGKFQRFEERLVLSFSRIILPDGSNVQIEGYAVDPGHLRSFGGFVSQYAFLQPMGRPDCHRISGGTFQRQKIQWLTKHDLWRLQRPEHRSNGVEYLQPRGSGLDCCWEGRGKNWGAFLKKTLIALPPYTLKAEQPLAFSF